MIETSCAEKRERGTKMKSIKRLAAAVLAFVMLFTAAVGMTTAAAEGAANPGAAAKTFLRNLPHRCFYKALSAASENMPKTQRTHAERRFLQNPAEKIPFDS